MQLSRVKSPTSCAPNSLLTASYSFFSSFYARSTRFPHSFGCGFHAAVPSAQDATAHTQRKVLLTHHRCFWAVGQAWPDTHSGTRSPLLRTCNAPALQPLTCRWPESSLKVPAKGKKRASLSRGNNVISRYFVLPAPTPPQPPAVRDLVQKTHLGDGASVYLDFRLRETIFCFVSQLLISCNTGRVCLLWRAQFPHVLDDTLIALVIVLQGTCTHWLMWLNSAN